MDKILVPVALFDKMVNYIVSKPYAEVEMLVNDIKLFIKEVQDSQVKKEDVIAEDNVVEIK